MLRGAVPGARVLAGRCAFAPLGEMVDMDAVVAIAKKKSAGEITEAEADEALRLPVRPAEEEPPPGDDIDAVLAEADAALGLAHRQEPMIDGSRRARPDR